MTSKEREACSVRRHSREVIAKAQSNRKALKLEAQPKKLGSQCVFEDSADQNIVFIVFGMLSRAKHVIYSVAEGLAEQKHGIYLVFESSAE